MTSPGSEPAYSVERLYRSTFDFFAPEADDQRKLPTERKLSCSKPLT